MAWRIEYLRSARKDVEQLDRPTAQRIRNFLEVRLAHLDDPRAIGEALKGSTLGSLWKYRVGDYRIIASIEDEAVRILVVRIGHKREVYRR
ncbi:MAG: type II toxin-antitoxin system RelE/ParE family toxin [Thiobacillaceae bacterium]|nr:type II toxin-antitoxin system RelE/ParE family toxin [Thiobacillaceae bacterium]